MADKMLRIAGRGSDGNAKAVKTDESGNVGVYLASNNGAISFKSLKANFESKDLSNNVNPNKAYHRTQSSIVSLPVFLVSSSAFTQPWYNLIKSNDGSFIPLSTSGAGAGQYKLVVFEFDLVKEVKNNLNFNGSITDLKNEITEMPIQFFGNGYGSDGTGGVYGVLLKVWNYVTLVWDTIGEAANYAEIKGLLTPSIHISEGGKVYILAHAEYPSSDTTSSTTSTDYINLDFSIKENRVSVDFKNKPSEPIYTKAQDFISMMGGRQGKSKEVLISDSNSKFHAFPAVLYTRSKKMIVAWRDATIHMQDKTATLRMKISNDNGDSFKEIVFPFQNVNEDPRDLFLLQEDRIGRIFLGGYKYIYNGTDYDLEPMLYYSDDDAETWLEVDIDTQLGGTFAPLSRRMIQDSEGDLYLFAYTETLPRSITMTKSTDTGFTWSSLATIITPSMLDDNDLSEAAMEFTPNKKRIVGVLRMGGGKNSAVVHSDDYGTTWSILTKNIGFPSHGADLRIGGQDALILLYRNGGSQPSIRTTYDSGLSWSEPLVTLGQRNGGYGQMTLISANLYAVVYDQGFADSVSDCFMRFVSLPKGKRQKSMLLKSWEKTALLLNFDYLTFGENYSTSNGVATGIDVSKTEKRMIFVENLHGADMKIEFYALMKTGEIMFDLQATPISIAAGTKKVFTEIDLPLINQPFYKLLFRVQKNPTRPTTGTMTFRVFGS